MCAVKLEGKWSVMISPIIIFHSQLRKVCPPGSVQRTTSAPLQEALNRSLGPIGNRAAKQSGGIPRILITRDSFAVICGQSLLLKFEYYWVQCNANCSVRPNGEIIASNAAMQPCSHAAMEFHEGDPFSILQVAALRIWPSMGTQTK